MITTDIAIIGAGLTGLTLQYFLRNHNFSVVVIEARNRPGGRIHTVRSQETAPVEMGATWIGKNHTNLNSLLQELKIDTFKQRLGKTAVYEHMSLSPFQLVNLPENSDPSYRIKDGSITLIEALRTQADSCQMYYDQVVQSIAAQGEVLEVITQNETFQSGIVVSTLPPNLLKQTVAITPALPPSFLDIMGNTHTWMGESIKFALTFRQPFWRAANTSGTVVSNVGPIPEMYDHSNFEDNRFALEGFLNDSYFSVSKEQRLKMILNQLKKYYGKAVEAYTDYQETVWAKDPFTHKQYSNHVLPHQHNGHAVYRTPVLEGRLFIAGSETAYAFPGYMEGAVQSAQEVYQQIIQRQSVSKLG